VRATRQTSTRARHCASLTWKHQLYLLPKTPLPHTVFLCPLECFHIAPGYLHSCLLRKLTYSCKHCLCLCQVSILNVPTEVHFRLSSLKRNTGQIYVAIDKKMVMAFYRKEAVDMLS